MEKVFVKEKPTVVQYVIDSMQGGSPEADVGRMKPLPGPGLRDNC